MVEQMNWAKEWIDFGFTFLATGLGVLGAFELDGWRERNRQHEKKRKLIRNLLDELVGLIKYIKENPSLVKFQSYALPVEVLLETVKDQIDLFQRKTSKMLGEFRAEVIVKNQELEEWKAINVAAIGNPYYATTEDAMTASNISGSWTSFVVNAEQTISLLKDQLEKELIG